MWKAFELLEEGLGPATMQAAINRELNGALKCAVPPAYTQLWDLKIKGMLTLNIDRLAYRGYQKSTVKDERLLERSGFEIRSLIGAINQPEGRFIANLHGQLEDPTNWVFTEKKLNSLLQQNLYTEFVRDCIKYCTVILIGISANDRAVVDHFIRARKDLINFGPHFWITDNDDFDTISNVELSGIQVISYKNSNGNHSELLEIIKDLKQFTPPISQAEPVLWGAEEGKITASTQHTPSEMMSKTPNELRIILNAQAGSILEKNDDENENQGSFIDFCKKYSRPIHAASYFDTEESSDANEVLGYKLISYQKEGGFAKVWQGHAPDGTPVAIKAFRYEIREQPELLEAFRRGVRSMRLLANRDINGIVKFEAASEIPPVVVMEWVDGATLHDAVTQGGLKTWAEKIRVLRDLVQIIYAAHNAPERVLHRDLRPQNIMLRNYYIEASTSEVVVLDFDLSWHVGAFEKSVYVAGGTAYLAPEQLAAQTGATTRSAAVDSFGFGMTAYFMLSRTDPTINAHFKPTWDSDLKLLASQNKCKEWKSLPAIISRLILASTRHQQNSRLSFSQVVSEIEQIHKAINNPEEILDPRMIAEEIFAKTEIISNYEIHDGWPKYVSHSGLTIESQPLTDNTGIRLVIHFMQRGHEKYQGLHAVGEYFKQIPGKFRSNLISKSDIRIGSKDFITTLHFEINQEKDLTNQIPKDLNAVLGKIISLLS